VNSEMSPLTRDFAEVIAPLGEDEERRAVEVALAHLGLRRPMVYGVELRIDKNRRSLPRRRIGVLLGELDGYLPYEVVVSDDAAVVSATARPDLIDAYIEQQHQAGRKSPQSPKDAKAAATQYRLWRTYQMSDHLPLWAELRIDFADDYLRELSKQQIP
jgi:hypothetical protein